MEVNFVAVLFTVGLVLNAASAGPAFPCNPSTGLNAFPFCDTRLSVGERVKDLIGRLTLQEKIGQLVNTAADVPRIGIPKYEWWSEALHGVSNVGPGTSFNSIVPAATSFPTVILSAASFNDSLWMAMGQAVSTEARAMHNVGMAGLTYWSPNVNIFRDPRWGRGHETPGEDPFLTSRYAATYVRGLQETGGPDPSRLKVAACCKHYTAYDLDNWNGVNRFTFNAQVSKYDLADTYNPPFYGCVKDGNVASVMCSYNQVNGVPTCADPNLLIGTVRGRWKLNGYIVSDCDSVDVLYNSQHYAPTPEDAVAYVLKAGLDLDCGRFLGLHTESAVNAGKVNESQIDQALTNTFTTLMRLGWFDGDPAKQPFGNLGAKDVCTGANQELALDAARQGIVLLKNTGALPLAANRIRSLAVIGPNANATDAMIGNYAGIPCKYTTPLNGLSKYTATLFAPGCANVLCGKNDLLAGAVMTASTADATVLIVGGDLTLEAEGLDRTSLLLPGYQQELVSQVANAAKGPVILVIMSGGPFDISFAKNNDKIAGILWTGYPGQDGGAAIADVIFGSYNPGGRLPVTWYPQDFVKVPMTDMNMRPSPRRGYPGRTYRFYTGPTIYNFGDGLSYTNFKTTLVKAPTLLYVPLKTKNACWDYKRNSSCQIIPISVIKCQKIVIDVIVDVENIGLRDGSHTVLLYSKSPTRQPYSPKKQLVAFRKIFLPARAKQRIHFKLEICKGLVFVDKLGHGKLVMGNHVLYIDDVQHSISLAVKM